MGTKLTETIDLCDSEEEGEIHSSQETSQDVIVLDDSNNPSSLFQQQSRINRRSPRKHASPLLPSLSRVKTENDDISDIQIVAVQLGPLASSSLGSKKRKSLRRTSLRARERDFIKPKLQGIQKKSPKKILKTPGKKRINRRRQADSPFFTTRTPQQKANQHKVNQVRKILQNKQYTQNRFHLNGMMKHDVVERVDRNLKNRNNDGRRSGGRLVNRNPMKKVSPSKTKFRFEPTTFLPTLMTNEQDPDYVPWSISTAPSTSAAAALVQEDDGDDGQKNPQVSVPVGFQQGRKSDPTTATTDQQTPSRIVTRTRKGGASFKITAMVEKTNENHATTLPQSVLPVSQPESSQQPQHSQPFSIYGSNMCVSKPQEAKVKGSLRPIVIDGSNVAMGHGNNKDFSCRGIEICSDYFKSRGHTVVAFVPRWRQKSKMAKDPQILDQLEKAGVCKFTPSRTVDGVRISSYDDRFIVQFACESGGVIVSNDNFRDLFEEQPLWRDTIRDRILQYTWVSDSYLMFPPDPMGQLGPTLDEFLRF